MRESPTDRLTPTVSTDALWLRSDGFWSVYSTPSQTPTEINSSCSTDFRMSHFVQIMPPPFKHHTHRLHTWISSLISSERSSVCLHIRAATPLWVSAHGEFQFTDTVLTGGNSCRHKWHIYISHTPPKPKHFTEPGRYHRWFKMYSSCIWNNVVIMHAGKRDTHRVLKMSLC